MKFTLRDLVWASLLVIFGAMLMRQEQASHSINESVMAVQKAHQSEVNVLNSKIDKLYTYHDVHFNFLRGQIEMLSNRVDLDYSVQSARFNKLLEERENRCEAD